MGKYLLSVHRVEGAPRVAMSDEEMQEMTRRVYALEKEMDAAGVLIFGGQLQPDTAAVARANDGEVSVTDGPFAETKEQLGGFYIIDAAGRDDALAWASKVTGVINAPIEVRPFAHVS